MSNLNEKLGKLSKVRKEKIDKRAKDLIAEEMTLRDLRLARKKTQIELCSSLNMKQDGVSRLEHRSDMLLSTLNKYISSMGGELKLIAEFPDRAPVCIKNFEQLNEEGESSHRN